MNGNQKLKTNWLAFVSKPEKVLMEGQVILNPETMTAIAFNNPITKRNMIPIKTMLVVTQPVLSLPLMSGFIFALFTFSDILDISFAFSDSSFVLAISTYASFSTCAILSSLVAAIDTNTSPTNVSSVRITLPILNLVSLAYSKDNAVYPLVRTAYNHTNGNSVMTRWPVFGIGFPVASSSVVGSSDVFAISARLVANT